MAESIVDVNHVSMRFNLSSEKVDSFKEYFIKRITHSLKAADAFWALSDVDFHMKRGDSVALVGLNGSGKSTLLKTVAGVLKPTKGDVRVYGTIAPIIELGAGFDMELTARENIFLNGAILGNDRKTMEGYYDDIVDFSELQDFMDIPIKNFSSGMMARLAFATATIGKPDLLIVDEVLAVGDFRFQEKCQDRIARMRKNDTSILFVSHSIDQVEQICHRAIWLEHGHVMMDGPSSEVAEKYRNAY